MLPWDWVAAFSVQVQTAFETAAFPRKCEDERLLFPQVVNPTNLPLAP